ncbi:MAG: GNAT family N-acetyltransferase [Cryomorphaceae bacterium]|jgi:diamine N-acetyltransferase|nr:GNAT family N-acetyltransferase [Cryomorphaceae bacterium]
MSLKGSLVVLRAVEKDDASTIFMWENNPDNWKVSNTEVPFSLFDIHQLIEHQSDIRKSGQMRLVIQTALEERPVGVIDLYDLNFKHGYGAVGILIAADADKRKGYAAEALQLFTTYCKEILELRNLYCQIHGDNQSSILLFEKAGFIHAGTRNNWLRFKNEYFDELTYQLCLQNKN